MKQLSLIILMWFSTLYLNAQQKFDIELFPISVYSMIERTTMNVTECLQRNL